MITIAEPKTKTTKTKTRTVALTLDLVGVNRARLQALAIECLKAETIGIKAAIAKDAGELLARFPSFSTYAAFKKCFGLSYFASVNSSAKIEKSAKRKVDTLILYLAASQNAGIELCMFATKECRELCLVASGRAMMESGRDPSKQSIAIARIIKSWIFHFRADIARAVLSHEITSKGKAARKRERSFAVRLNGTSDIDHSETIREFPGVSFYDYTKRPLPAKLPANYSICYSFANFSPARVKQYQKAVSMGLNIAVPVIASDFEKAVSLPFAFNADRDDLRHLDKERGQLAILKVKRTPNLQANQANAFVLDFAGVQKLARLLSLQS